jgi:DUF2934 family protein
MSKSMKTYREPTQDEIAACAHMIYEQEGRPEGKAMEHWLQAEAQLTAERKAQAQTAVTSAKAAPTAQGKKQKGGDASWQGQSPNRDQSRANPN